MKRPMFRFLWMTIWLIALSILLNVLLDSKIISLYTGVSHSWVSWLICLLWLFVASMLIRYSSKAIQNSINRSSQFAKISVLVARVYSTVGYAFMIVIGLHLIHIKVGSILVGGALTGVVVGIGAQSTLSNVFAGIILLTLHPFSIGQTITVRTYLFSGVEYSGVVEDINWYHTVIRENGQKRVIPNSAMIQSAITIISDTHSMVYPVPVPYSVSIDEFKQALMEKTGDSVDVIVREFRQDEYVLDVTIPSQMKPDDLRAVLNHYQNRGQKQEL
ncbi:mechanosensitive ion channel family protein [Alicyclobacillus ferrooxydans]|uniref:mechanosensitive ion channel family protein n=1 Tax=Alicyclobacillus ferrooxydans TaxID=471514 RepID=UPI000B049263|nr:mechanosensitive ion channel family protein [Alicyclobacillus ferrooxydans]